MIDMSRHGFKHKDAFKKARGVPRSAFDSIVADPDWKIVKLVFSHPECPLDIRDKFRQDKVWWKRLVAIYSKGAPMGYTIHGLRDKDRRVRRAYLNGLFNQTTDFLKKLEVLT